MISPELLELLACPACDNRPAVHLSPDQCFLVCDQCGRRYPIEEDIPIMLVDAAIMPETAGTGAAPK